MKNQSSLPSPKLYILILLLPPTNSCCILHKPCQERSEGPLFVGVHFSRTLNPETLARAHSRLRQYKGGCGRRRCRSGLATVGSSRLFVYVYVYVRVYGCRRMHIGFCLYTCITVYAFVWTRTCVYICIDMYVLFSCSFFFLPPLWRVYLLHESTYLHISFIYCLATFSYLFFLPLCVCVIHICQFLRFLSLPWQILLTEWFPIHSFLSPFPHF